MMHYVSHHTNSKLRVEQTTAPALSPWQKLANAIVEQAVKDYRMEQARVKANPQNADQAKAEVGKLERFFCSDWFEVLTDVDGRLILSRLKKEAA